MRKIPQKDRARSCQSEKRGSKPRHICITHHIGSTPPRGWPQPCQSHGPRLSTFQKDWQLFQNLFINLCLSWSLDWQLIWLTHCGLVTPYGGRDLGQHWFRSQSPPIICKAPTANRQRRWESYLTRWSTDSVATSREKTIIFNQLHIVNHSWSGLSQEKYTFNHPH